MTPLDFLRFRRLEREIMMLRWLLGEDFFISYSRGDGLAYAAALGNALAAQGFS